jgi:autotransporter-associated beta strand protein
MKRILSVSPESLDHPSTSDDTLAPHPMMIAADRRWISARQTHTVASRRHARIMEGDGHPENWEGGSMLGLFWGARSGFGSDRGRRTGQRVAAVQRAHRPTLEGLEVRIAPAATDVWTGAVNGSWSNPGNWVGDVAPNPTAGDSLDFPASASNLTNANDFANATFNSIKIEGAGYNLGGNALTLSGGITASYTTGMSTDAINTTLTAVVAPITVGATSTSVGILDISGVLSGPAGVNVTGGGILNLMGSSPNTYTGATTIASGTTLIVDSTVGGVQVSGGVLAGNGSVGAVNSVGGAILPGHPAIVTGTPLAAPGQLTANGSVTLDSGSSFLALLNGTSVGNGVTGYSQLVVRSGTVNLGGAKLATALGTSYTPMVRDQLTIILNGTGAPINGVFAGLPEGAAVTVGSSLFRISYLGPTGSTHDVVLSAVSATSTTTLLPVGLPTAPNQPFTLTAQVSGSQGTPTGTVEFFNGNPSAGGTLLTTATLNASGIATATVASLGTIGASTAIYAVYVPTPTDFTYAGSTSTPITFGTTTTLTSSSPVAGIGQPVTFTATVMPSSPGAGTPMGSVAFSVDGITVATVPLNPVTGQASFSDMNLGIGTHLIVANFLANPPFQNSTSNMLTQSISTAGTLPVLTIVPVRNRHGQVLKFDLMVQVVPLTAGVGTPTGSVTYFINGRASYQTVQLTDGVAMLTVLRPRLLNHFVYARYNGSSSFVASASPQTYVSHRLLAGLSRTAARQGDPAGSSARRLRGS